MVKLMVDSWTSASLIENKYRVRYGWTVCNGKMEWNFGWRQRATESIRRYLIILKWCHCLSYGKGYIEISTFLISNILWLTFGLLVGIWSRCWVWVCVCVPTNENSPDQPNVYVVSIVELFFRLPFTPHPYTKVRLVSSFGCRRK